MNFHCLSHHWFPTTVLGGSPVAAIELAGVDVNEPPQNSYLLMRVTNRACLCPSLTKDNKQINYTRQRPSIESLPF